MAEQDINGSVPPQPVAYAAQRLNITLNECWQMIRSGELESVEIDGTPHVTWPSLQEWISKFYRQQRAAVFDENSRKFHDVTEEFQRRIHDHKFSYVESGRWYLDRTHELEREKQSALDELVRRFGVVRSS